MPGDAGLRQRRGMARGPWSPAALERTARLGPLTVYMTRLREEGVRGGQDGIYGGDHAAS